MSEEPSIIEELRESYGKLGPVRKVIRTQFGIASGNTRRKAVPEWPETYKEVKDYYEHLKIMTADNIQEEKKPKWWTRVLSEAAKELEKQGVEKGKIVARLEQDFPLSRTSIYRYLPKEFKEPEKVKAGEASAEARVKAVPIMGTESGESLAESKESLKEKRSREPRSYPGPTASEHRRSTYTDAHVDMLNTLSEAGLRCASEVSFERPCEFKCLRCRREFSGPHLKEPPNCSTCHIPMQTKSYIADILVNDKLIVEVEGEGSASKDNWERDKFFQEQYGLKVFHIANQDVKLPGTLQTVKDLLEEKAAEVQEPKPAASGEAPSVVEPRGQPEQPPQPLQRIVEQIEIGVKEGHFTWKGLLAKMDAQLSMQLAAAYRATLIPGSKCPVCGHQLSNSSDQVLDALARLEQMDVEG